jgi:hypothetical protein
MDTVSGTTLVPVWGYIIFFKAYVGYNGYRISGTIRIRVCGPNGVSVQPRYKPFNDIWTDGRFQRKIKIMTLMSSKFHT